MDNAFPRRSVIRTDSVDTVGEARRRRKASIIITIILHCFLWLSLASIVLAGFMLSELSEPKLIPSASLVIAASLGSIAYIAIHSAFAKHQKDKIERGLDSTRRFIQLKWTALILSTFLTILWLGAGIWGVVIAAGTPICQNVPDTIPATRPSWKYGLPCIGHRVTTGIALFLCLVSICLILLLRQSYRPFESNMFGQLLKEEYEEEERGAEVKSLPDSLQSDPISDYPVTRTSHLSHPMNIPPPPTFSRRASAFLEEAEMRHQQNNMLHFRRATIMDSTQFDRSIIEDPVQLQRSLSLTDPSTIVRAASLTRIGGLAHPRPVRRIPSASTLMPQSPHPLQRTHSASSIQHPLRQQPVQIFEYRGSSSIRPISRSSSLHTTTPRHTFHYPQNPRLARSGTIANHSSFRNNYQGVHGFYPGSRARSNTYPHPRSTDPYALSWNGMPVPNYTPQFSKPPFPRRAGSLLSTTQLSDHAEEDEEAMTPARSPTTSSPTLTAASSSGSTNTTIDKFDPDLPLPVFPPMKMPSVDSTGLKKAKSTGHLGMLTSKGKFKGYESTIDVTNSLGAPGVK